MLCLSQSELWIFYFRSPVNCSIIIPAFEEAIEKVGAGLRNGYFNKNLVTPEDIMRYFTPRSKGDWARDVSYIMEEIGE